MNRSFSLNISQKVIVGMTICFLAIGFVGGNSYRFLREIERKQRLIEIADDLSKIILEIWRYGKNFLLYGSKDDLAAKQQAGLIVLGPFRKKSAFDIFYKKIR